MMSFNCFIIFVGRLLGPVLLLAFRSEIRSSTSSMVLGVIKKVRFGAFIKLEKLFLVGRMFFCNFLHILVKKLLKSSATPRYVFDLYLFYHLEFGTKEN